MQDSESLHMQFKMKLLERVHSTELTLRKFVYHIQSVHLVAWSLCCKKVQQFKAAMSCVCIIMMEPPFNLSIVSIRSICNCSINCPRQQRQHFLCWKQQEALCTFESWQVPIVGPLYGCAIMQGPALRRLVSYSWSVNRTMKIITPLLVAPSPSFGRTRILIINTSFIYSNHWRFC
jgi:hypothetical protein